MTKGEMDVFIEKMEEFGDIWERDQVERVYGDWTLEDALVDRGKDHFFLGHIIETILNRPIDDEGE